MGLGFLEQGLGLGFVEFWSFRAFGFNVTIGAHFIVQGIITWHGVAAFFTLCETLSPTLKLQTPLTLLPKLRFLSMQNSRQHAHKAPEGTPEACVRCPCWYNRNHMRVSEPSRHLILSRIFFRFCDLSNPLNRCEKTFQWAQTAESLEFGFGV